MFTPTQSGGDDVSCGNAFCLLSGMFGKVPPVLYGIMPKLFTEDTDNFSNLKRQHAETRSLFPAGTGSFTLVGTGFKPRKTALEEV
jgi:hypothetical protein